MDCIWTYVESLTDFSQRQLRTFVVWVLLIGIKLIEFLSKKFKSSFVNNFLSLLHLLRVPSSWLQLQQFFHILLLFLHSLKVQFLFTFNLSLDEVNIQSRSGVSASFGVGLWVRYLIIDIDNCAFFSPYSLSIWLFYFCGLVVIELGILVQILIGSIALLTLYWWTMRKTVQIKCAISLFVLASQS